MKLLHTICAALMMVAITSCDEHREFPDTAMKTCDILCTDGKVVRYEDMKSQGKQPIAVVFHITRTMRHRELVMPFIFGTLRLKHTVTVSVLSIILRLTLPLLTGT